MGEPEQLGQGPYFIKCLSTDLHKSIPRFDLGLDFIIFGRSKDCDVYIKEDNISKFHALLIKLSSAWYLTDFDSTNGVFVNHQKLISKHPYQLVEGDIFSLGPSELVSFKFGSYKTEDGQSPVKSLNFVNGADDIQSLHLSQVAKLQDKIEQLQDELALTKKDKNEDDSLNETIQKLKDELQSKTDLLDSQLSQAAIYRDEMMELEKNLSGLEKRCSDFKDTRDMLYQRISELVKENENSKKVTEEIKELQDMNLLNQETIAKLRIESERHQNEAKDANEEIKKLKTHIEKITNDYQTSNEALQNANLVCQETQSELRRLQSEFQTVLSENKSLSTDITKMEMRITTRNENLIKENKALIIKNKNFSFQIAQMNQKLSQVSKGQYHGNNQDLQDMQNHVNLVMENELNCPICSEFFINAVTLGCSHVFCHFCISSWKQKKRDCPTCRKAITTEALSPVIDNFINKMVLYLSNDIKTQRDKIIEERRPKMPAQQQQQKTGARGAQAQPNAWQQVRGRHHNSRVDVAPNNESNRQRGRDSANAYNPPSFGHMRLPPRLERQNYAQAAGNNSNRYDLEFF